MGHGPRHVSWVGNFHRHRRSQTFRRARDFHGDPSKASLDFDGNAISGVHGDNAQEVVDAGLLYQVTGDPRYSNQLLAS